MHELALAIAVAGTTGAAPTAATRVDVVSTFSGDMMPGTPRCEPAGQFYCTIYNRYTVSFPPDFGRRFASALLHPVPAPDPAALGLHCAATPSVIHSIEVGSELEHMPGGKNAVSLKVYLDNGERIEAKSRSEVQFGIPWTIIVNGQTQKSYNAEIGRMASTFFYGDDLNRPVLQGTSDWARITDNWCYMWQSA